MRKIVQYRLWRTRGSDERTKRRTRAKIDDVSRHLRVHHLLDVHPDLKIVSSSSRTEILDASDLVRESNTSSALDATAKEKTREETRLVQSRLVVDEPKGREILTDSSKS